MSSVHGVVVLADQRYEAPLIQAIQSRSDVLAIVRRCADLAEVVAAARAGLADLAVIDGSDPDLTIETVESLRACGMVVVALAAHHERSRLIALGVASVAAPGSPDQVVNSLIAATRTRRSTPATASSAFDEAVAFFVASSPLVEGPNGYVRPIPLGFHDTAPTIEWMDARHLS